jgi:hypothetical protein
VRLAIVMAATVAGAALFAALHPAPRDAYEAAATLVIPVQDSDAAEVAPRTLQAAELIRQPSIVGQALERAFQGSEPGRVLSGMDVEPRPRAGIVRFSVRAATARNATLLAEELARVTVEALQRGRSTGERFGLRIVGDFEVGTDRWGPTGTGDGLAAVGLVPGGRYGGSALRALCDVTAGCGVARVIQGRFQRGRPVTLTAWVRGRQPSRVLLALGSGRTNDRGGTTAAVGREWRRLEVRWVPAQDESLASLALNNAGPGLSDVDLDGVLLVTDGDRLSEAQEQRLFAERGHAYATPPRIVGSRTGRTVRWAAIGAVAGLVVGVASMVAWTLAGRRRESLSAQR